VLCQKTIGKSAVKLLKTQEKATRSCLDQIAKGKIVGDPTRLCRGGVSNAGTTILPAEPKAAKKIGKALQKLGTRIAIECGGGLLEQMAACASYEEDVEACVASTIQRGVTIVSSAGYGSVGTIADVVGRTCQQAIGKLGGKHLATITKAMTSCLDKLNAGDLMGSGDTLCLGAGTANGFTAPTDPVTADALQRASDTLVAGLAQKCPGAIAAPLDACGNDPAGLAACLQCANGHQALATIRAVYGPP
jgi:hypothetical protein